MKVKNKNPKPTKHTHKAMSQSQGHTWKLLCLFLVPNSVSSHLAAIHAGPSFKRQVGGVIILGPCVSKAFGFDWQTQRLLAIGFED